MVWYRPTSYSEVDWGNVAGNALDYADNSFLSPSEIWNGTDSAGINAAHAVADQSFGINIPFIGGVNIGGPRNPHPATGPVPRPSGAIQGPPSPWQKEHPVQGPPIKFKGKKSFKTYNSWRGKDGKIHHRGEAAPAADAGGGSESFAADLASQVDPNLPEFGAPDYGRVNSIVQSIIADATKQYRHANQDIKKDLRGDIGSITGTALSYDHAGAALNAGNAMMRAKQQGDALASKGLRDGMMQRMRNSADQASQTTGVPDEYAIADAASNADNVLESASIDSGSRGFQDMVGFSRLANVEDANRAVMGTRAQARRAMAENNRSLAEIRSQKAKAGLDVEKQLLDMHIAQRLAEAEYAGRGEQVAGAQYDRMAGDRTAGMQQQELQANLKGTPAQRNEIMQKNYARASEILNGTATKMRVPTQVDLGEKNADGSPKLSTVYQEVMQPSGGPVDYDEAVHMLSQNGLNGPRWTKLARQWWSDRTKATNIAAAQGANAARQLAVGFFTGGSGL